MRKRAPRRTATGGCGAQWVQEEVSDVSRRWWAPPAISLQAYGPVGVVLAFTGLAWA